MFRELLAAWRSKDILSQMVDELAAMLTNGEMMFHHAWDVLLKGRDATEVRDDLYARDGRVNELEWKVRRQIVEHLTINPGVQAPACLVLMSVVKDADRVADYSKNLFETAELLPDGMGDDPYAAAFGQLAEDIHATFEKTCRAFVEEDTDLGQELVEHEVEVEKRCDRLVRQLTDADLPCRQAVAYTLVARHLKRISAHLGNIASAVVMPVHKIDYFDPKWHRED